MDVKLNYCHFYFYYTIKLCSYVTKLHSFWLINMPLIYKF